MFDEDGTVHVVYCSGMTVVRGGVCECICLHVCVCLPLQGDRKSTRAKFKCQVCRLQFASISVSRCQHTVFYCSY